MIINHTIITHDLMNNSWRALSSPHTPLLPARDLAPGALRPADRLPANSNNDDSNDDNNDNSNDNDNDNSNIYIYIMTVHN